MVYHLLMSREDPQMKIRLPADLKDQIESASKNSGRSMNAEIVARLEASFVQVPTAASEDTNVVKGVEKTNLETRLMDLWTQRLNEEVYLRSLEGFLDHLKNDQSDDAKIERYITERDSSSTMRRLKALDQAIDATFAFANQKGIHLDPEELNQGFR